MPSSKQVCQFICQRIVYYFLIGLVVTAIVMFGLDFLVVTLPMFQIFYDVSNPQQNTAITLPEAIPARSALMKLPFPGQFYQFDQADGAKCLVYSRDIITSLPNEVVFARHNPWTFFQTKQVINCVGADNLDTINSEFYIWGMSMTILAVISVTAVVAFIAEWSVIICCNGWCRCSCTAWCQLCQSPNAQKTHAVLYTPEIDQAGQQAQASQPQAGQQVEALQPQVYQVNYRQV